MTKVLILGGGTSSERDISLRSAEAVSAALQAAGYAVIELDTGTLENDFDYIERIQEADIVFPVLHGAGGEDGQIQSQLESLGCSYVGADAVSSALCFDKWKYKLKISADGIQTPQGEIVDLAKFNSSDVPRERPFVLKPLNGGSSLDTFIVRKTGQYDPAEIGEAFKKHPQMLLEELITGTEITVGVLGTEVLPVIEIIPPEGGEFDYANKYNGSTRELCPPRSIGEAVQKHAQKLAMEAHKLVGARDMSRTDMIIGHTGNIYVLETNTIPGMTTTSLFPKAAAAAGYDMPAVVTKLVEAAAARAVA